MFVLKIIAKFIKVLQSAESPTQVAWGFAFGSIIGLTPMMSLHNLILLILIFILKVNIAAAMLAFIVFSLVAFLFDPIFHSIGYFFLVEVRPIFPFWTDMYNAPVAPLTRYNNTILMGSLICALLALYPNYLWFKWFIKKYRETWGEKIKSWKIVRVVKGSKIVRLYVRIKNLGE